MKKIKNKNILILIGILIFSLIFGYMYVYNEDKVYVYDYIGYQLRFSNLSNIFQTDVKLAIKTLIANIRTEDYNYFPVLFLVPFKIIFGDTRLTYILSMIILYYVPIVYILIRFISKELDLDKKKNNLFKITIIITIFCFTSFWAAMLRGLPDIIGLIPMGILLLRFKPFDNKIPIKDLILNGILIYLPFLCRRWYAYSMVSHYFAILIISLLNKKEFNKKRLFLIVKNILISGITTSICVLVLQTPLFIRILNTQYNNTYSAYQVNFKQHFINFFNEYGLVIIILMIIGIIGSLKNNKKLKLMLYSTINIIVFSFLFTRVQGMGVHHFLGISLYVIILSILGIHNIYSFISKDSIKKIFLLIILILVSLNFCTTFIFRNKSIPLISQNNKYYKFRYENYDQLLKFEEDLSNLINNNYGKVSFFASTGNISDSLIDTIGNSIIKQNLYYTSNIDLRDGFNFNSLLYKYVVVTSEPEVGTSITGQQVLVYPNNLIYSSEGIGTSYKQVLGPYILQDNIEVYVYEKIEAFKDEDINNYIEYFLNLYPEWKEDITNFDKIILASNIKLGDKLGDIKRIDNNTYYIHPGYDETEINLDFNKKDYTKLSLKFYLDSSIPENTKTNVKIYNNKKIICDEELSNNGIKELELDLEKNKNITIVVDYGEKFEYDRVYFDYNIE